MDPVAITKSALGILQQFKQQIDDANATIEQAMQLKKHIDVLEVTIMMIPTRSSSSNDKFKEEIEPCEEKIIVNDSIHNDPTNMSSSTDDKFKKEIEPCEEEIHNDPINMQKIGKVAIIGAFNAAKVAPADWIGAGDPEIGSGINEYTGMIASMYASIQGSKDNNLSYELSKRNLSPAVVLSDMKNARDKKTNLRIFTDLDVMFCGMVFIVKNALEAIEEAVTSIKDIAALQQQNLSFCIPLPWNIRRIIAMREILKQHASILSEQTISLQNAIGIASYNVQLQMYESLMDASSNLDEFYDMRELWKKKIGPDKTRTTASEFCEALLMSLNSWYAFKDLRKKYLFNNFKYRFSNDNILLGRYINELYNTQRDDYISVFELSDALTKIFSDETNMKKSAFEYTKDVLIDKEKNFAASIVFEFIDVNKINSNTEHENHNEKKNDKAKHHYYYYC